MSMIVILTLIAALLGGGGVGLAYAADGSVPGDALYGVDTSIESIQYALTLGHEAKAQLALAFADERLTELQDLIDDGAGEEEIQQAVDGYGHNVSQAAQALAAVAASGDEVQRAEALKTLLQESLSIHTQVLTEARERVPDQAGLSIDYAIGVSETGGTVMEDLFSQGMPGGPPEDTSGEIPEAMPGSSLDKPSPPVEVPSGSEYDAPGSLAEDFVDRIEGLQARVDSIGQLSEEDRYEELESAIGEYENEVDVLAQALADVAQEDEARAEALAVLLEEALAQHSRVLNDVLDAAPDQAKDYIAHAISASEVVREIIRNTFDSGVLDGAPEGVPAGVPSGTGDGKP